MDNGSTCLMLLEFAWEPISYEMRSRWLNDQLCELHPETSLRGFHNKQRVIIVINWNHTKLTTTLVTIGNKDFIIVITKIFYVAIAKLTLLLILECTGILKSLYTRYTNILKRSYIFFSFEEW